VTIESDQTTWQWIANAATAGVLAIGGFLFKSYTDRVKALEATHKGLVSTDYLDDRLREMTEERRWMHEQNQVKLDNLTERIDGILDRE
jgi:hypothetical protein